MAPSILPIFEAENLVIVSLKPTGLSSTPIAQCFTTFRQQWTSPCTLSTSIVVHTSPSARSLMLHFFEPHPFSPKHLVISSFVDKRSSLLRENPLQYFSSLVDKMSSLLHEPPLSIFFLFSKWFKRDARTTTPPKGKFFFH